jgi:hypothetical protein
MTAGYQHFKEYTASIFRVEQLSILKSRAQTFFETAVPYAQNYAA